MTGEPVIRCSICREEQVSLDGWFLVMENRWTDRVKILSWNPALVSRTGIHAACCAAHVQQLVVHWMATGSLDYAFARSRPRHRHSLRGRHDPPPEISEREPDTQGSKVLGELAVHRESLERVLAENPESLAGILKALLSALGEPPIAAAEPELEEVQEEDSYELMEV
jgi:hypothetical protein